MVLYFVLEKQYLEISVSNIQKNKLYFYNERTYLRLFRKKDFYFNLGFKFINLTLLILLRWLRLRSS